MRTANDELLSSNVDLSSDYTSPAIYLGSTDNFSLQLIFTGSPSGAFRLEVSNDKGDPNNPVEANRGASITGWTTLAGSNQRVAAAGDHMWVSSTTPYTWIRVIWTANGGSGNLTNIKLQKKGY